MITILLSHERSGSHLLAELIASFDEVAVFDEVCNAHAVPPSMSAESWHGYRHSWITRDPKNPFELSFAAHVELVSAYFRSLEQLRPGQHIVIDIKYGHIANFDWYWSPLFGRPLLFHICDILPMQILHLHRLNVVEAVVSQHSANTRKVWHSWQPEAQYKNEEQHILDAAAVAEEANLLLMQSSWIKEKWAKSIRWYEITYETLVKIADGRESADDLAGFVGGLQTAPFKPSLQKLGRSLQETVENFDELVATCRAAGLGQFV